MPTSPEKKPELKEEMTNDEILKKAIEKARAKGFALDEGLWQGEEFYKNYAESLAYYQLIFSHDFAKAFWGKKIHGGTGSNTVVDSKGVWQSWGYEWEYHLQQMVIQKEPLQYLAKFL